MLLSQAEQTRESNRQRSTEAAKLSCAYALRANGAKADLRATQATQYASFLSPEQQHDILSQVVQCQDESVLVCAFYNAPDAIAGAPSVPQLSERGRFFEWILLNKPKTAFEFAKYDARINAPQGWAKNIYASLITQQYETALFRAADQAFRSTGIDDPVLRALASQLASEKKAYLVIAHSAAAVLSSQEIDAASARRAIDYLDRFSNIANSDELYYLSQIYSRPLTPAYNLSKSLNLAARSFELDPRYASALQIARVLARLNQEQNADIAQAWQLILQGLTRYELQALISLNKEDEASVKAVALAEQCQGTGLGKCNLTEVTRERHDQAWPHFTLWTEGSAKAMVKLVDLQNALATYIGSQTINHVNEIDRLMRAHAAPTFVVAIAQDLQRSPKTIPIALKYTLLAGGIEQDSPWPIVLLQQANQMSEQSDRNPLFFMGLAYWQAGIDFTQGFPVQNQELAKLFFERAVNTGRYTFVRDYSDMLSEGTILSRDPLRAVQLYEFTLQQGARQSTLKLAALLEQTPEINHYLSKAYAYALMARDGPFGPLISTEAVDLYAKRLTGRQKEQAQVWAQDCIEKDFYLCDLYEPNNIMLQLPRSRN